MSLTAVTQLGQPESVPSSPPSFTTMFGEWQLDDPHAQDLDDGVALVVHGDDDRELPVRDRVVRSGTGGSRLVSSQSLLALLPIPLVGGGQASLS
jgi:hypothetical protein